MAIVLCDDGTLDTVLKCTECGEEFRLNYDPDLMRQIDYDEFVQSSIEEMAEEHVCHEGEEA